MCFYCFCHSKYYKSISPPLNLLTPKSNQHLISAYNMTSESYIKVNKGNDHQLKKLLTAKQILLVSIIGNVWRKVWRICIMMLGCKGLNVNFLMMCTFSYGHLILVSIFYQLIYEKNQGCKGNLTHCRQILQLIKFSLIKNMKGKRGNQLAQFKFSFLSIVIFFLSYGKVYSFPHFTVFCSFVCLLS